MTTPTREEKSGSSRVWRLIVVGAVIGAVAAVVYGLVKRMTEPKR